MIKVCLHGELGLKYGEEHSFHINSVPEAIRALGYQLDGFIQDLYKGEFHVLRGNEAISEEHLELRLGLCNEIHFIPVPVGSKSGGLGKIILGVVLVASAFIFAPTILATGATGLAGGGVGTVIGLSETVFAGISYGQLAAFGGLIALSGASALLSPTPEVANFDDQEPADERASFLFNNKPNRSRQGGPVPVGYGRFRTGAVLLQGALDTIQIPLDQVLDVETNAFEEYLMTPEGENGSLGSWRHWHKDDIGIVYDGFVGTSLTDLTRKGFISTSSYRGHTPIMGIGEFRDDSSGLFSFYITLWRVDNPQDWIVKIEIENPPGSITQTYFTILVDNYEPRQRIKMGIDDIFRNRQITTWMWELDPQEFTMNHGEDILIKLEYFIEP